MDKLSHRDRIGAITIVLFFLCKTILVAAQTTVLPNAPHNVSITTDSSNSTPQNIFSPEIIRKNHSPTTYQIFLPPANSGSLKQSDLSKKYLILAEGTYLIDNPLILDAKNSIISIHGVDRMRSILLAKNPGQPLFLIRDATYVDITNLRLSGFSQNDGTNIRTEGSGSIVMDISDCFIEKGSLLFTAPGSYRIQASYLTGQGQLSSQIILDNPAADLFIFGGNITNSGIKGGTNFKSYAHAWIKSGRFRIFGTGVQASNGLADFKIEAPTKIDEPHQIVNVRSEGNNGYQNFGSAFAYIPSTEKSVDVDIINSAGSWQLSGAGKSTFALYNSSGRLNLIGNSSASGVGDLVTHDTNYKYHLIAAGNIVSQKIVRDSLADSSSVYLGNLQAGLKVGGKIMQLPIYSLDSLSSPTLSPYFSISIELPPIKNRPRVMNALPGMNNVKDFGAKGDGSTDDTQSIQKALNAGRLTFFPSGNYLISSTLHFNSAGNYKHGEGGYIVGENSFSTIIQKTNGGTVFQTEAMAYATIQGLTFRSKRPNLNDGSEAVKLEWKTGVTPATQEITVYDVTIENANIGLGIGDDSTQQCSENLFSNLTIRNSNVGISIGSYNALANIFTNTIGSNLNIGIAHSGKYTGGTWSLLNPTFIDIADVLFSFNNSSDSVFFIENLKTDALRVINTPASGATFNIFINNSTLQSPDIQFHSGGGIFINKANLLNARGDIDGKISESYIINNTKTPIKGNIKSGAGNLLMSP